MICSAQILPLHNSKFPKKKKKKKKKKNFYENNAKVLIKSLRQLVFGISLRLFVNNCTLYM